MLSNKLNKNIDFVSLSLLLNIIPICIFSYRNDNLQCILCLLSTQFSFLYHITYESSKFFLYLDTSTSIICIGNFIIKIYYSYYKYYYILMISISLYFYYLGTGRQKDYERSKQYIYFHTLWHLSACITGITYGLLEY
jgi:hypothetical protein